MRQGWFTVLGAIIGAAGAISAALIADKRYPDVLTSFFRELGEQQSKAQREIAQLQADNDRCKSEVSAARNRCQEELSVSQGRVSELERQNMELKTMIARLPPADLPKAKADQVKNPAYETQYVRIEVVALERTTEGLLLRLRYVNKTDQEVEVQLNGSSTTYLVDQAANQCHSATRGQGSVPPRGIRIAEVVFDGYGGHGGYYGRRADRERNQEICRRLVPPITFFGKYSRPSKSFASIDGLGPSDE